MKQKIVIKVSMPCEKSRAKAMALAARADGVMSVGITGDGKDRLQVIGDGVDAVCLVSCLRKKIGHAEILQVEEVKADTENQPEEPEVIEQQLPYNCYSGGYHPPPPPMVVCDEQSNCIVM